MTTLLGILIYITAVLAVTAVVPDPHCLHEQRVYMVELLAFHSGAHANRLARPHTGEFHVIHLFCPFLGLLLLSNHNSNGQILQKVTLDIVTEPPGVCPVLTFLSSEGLI